MAQRYAVRWRPQAYRSTTESIIVGRSAERPDPLTGDMLPAQPGQRVQTLQLIVFDDTSFPTSGSQANPYRPGHFDTERHLIVADEVAITLEISAFDGLTTEQATALWNQARDAQIARWEAETDIGAVIQSAIGAHLSPVVIR